MTQTELTYEPAPVPPRLCSDPSTIEARWQAFDDRHPSVWLAFRNLALRAISAGRKRIGAKALWEAMRWEMWLEAGDDAPKLNNDFTALYSRKFARIYPQHAGVFKYRKRAGEEP